MTRKKARKAKIWFCRAVFMYSLTGHTRRFNLRFPGNLRLAGGSPERRKERMLAEERPERSYMPGTWLSSSSASFTPSSTMQFGAGKFSRFSHPDWKRELTWQVEEGETPREQSTWAHFAKTSVFFFFFLFLVCTTWPAWGQTDSPGNSCTDFPRGISVLPFQNKSQIRTQTGIPRLTRIKSNLRATFSFIFFSLYPKIYSFTNNLSLFTQEFVTIIHGV